MKKTIKLLLAFLALSLSLISFTHLGKNVIAREVEHNEAAPSSYYSSVDTSSGEKLMESLTSIISSGHSPQGYDALWTAYKTTDIKPNTTNIVWDMYSNTNYDVTKDHGGNYSKEGDMFNREHTVPQSWFSKNNPMVCDVHHIYPTDGKVNGMRSNYLHGEVDKTKTIKYTSTNGCMLGTSSSPLYSGTVFEVPDEYKGDFARTYFYMATRYSSQVGSWSGEANKVFKGTYPYLTEYSIDMYTKWDAMDPVSEKEIIRNDAAYKFQGNRNPYIDHPEYVSMIWQSKYNQNVEIDETKVNSVISQINELPQLSNITLNDKNIINNANASYSALNYKEKEAVTNYSKLQAALNKIAELENDEPIDLNTTISVTEALNIASSLAAGTQTSETYTITGKISGNIEDYNINYGNATFDITDGTSTITVFRAKEGASNASFTDSSFAEKIVIGNTVVIVGNIKNYKNASGSSLYEINPCYVLSSTNEETPVEPVEPTDPIDPVDPTDPIDPVDPTEPNPLPMGNIEIEFKGLNTPYTKNYSFKIGEYSFLTNVGFANPDIADFIRIGGNSRNATNIPSKFGISGKGGSIEMQFDVANSSGITFNVGGQMVGDGISKWTIFASTDGGTTWNKVTSGTTVSSSLTGTLALNAKNVRYALVVEGSSNPRLDLTSINIKASIEPTVDLKTVKTNKSLSVSYDIYNNDISNVNVSTVIKSHITNTEYNLNSVEYGVIYAEKSKIENEYYLIKASYDNENEDYYYTKATVVSEDGGFVVKASLELDIDTEYVAVVVCIQNDTLVFANQTTVNVSDMISYYLANNLITDAEQVEVLNTLIS